MLNNFCSRLPRGTTCAPLGRSVRGINSSSGGFTLPAPLVVAAKAVAKASAPESLNHGDPELEEKGPTRAGPVRAPAEMSAER
mmetsp:Transcript_84353/g.180700  ORF Transcript_84353/g.180700 Transcript_84353/m.180700 type:complete len:83 (+) Transcript_84353:80-328(+)